MTTTIGDQRGSTTRWRISIGGWFIIACAVTAESTSNSLKAYVLGTHFEGYSVNLYGTAVSLPGAMLVLAAIVVSLTQARTAWVALTPGDTKHRIISGLVAVMCIAISITAMASHIFDMQRSKEGAETQDSTAYETAKAMYDAKAADFERVKDSPSLDEVQAAYEAAVKNAGIDANIWNRTSGCKDATKKASQQECAKMPRGFEEKLAAAKLKEKLDGELPALKADVERHTLKASASDAEKTASGIWAWLIGIGIVTVATFGAYIFAKPETTTERSGNSGTLIPASMIVPANDIAIPGIPSPTSPDGGGRRGRKANPDVASYADEFRKRHGNAPSGSDIRAQFPELPVSTAYDYARRSRTG